MANKVAGFISPGDCVSSHCRMFPMSEPQTTKLSVRGCSIALMRLGAGRPLLFLHGGGGAGWLPFLADLAARHDVLAPEHPGFGAPDTPDRLHSIHELARVFSHR